MFSGHLGLVCTRDRPVFYSKSLCLVFTTLPHKSCTLTGFLCSNLYFFAAGGENGNDHRVLKGKTQVQLQFVGDVRHIFRSSAVVEYGDELQCEMFCSWKL